MTAVEKILARACGRAKVSPGEVIEPVPDFIMIHDGVVLAAKNELDALGITQLADPLKVVMVTDHDVLYNSELAVRRGAFNRKAARDWGVERFFDIGRGGHGHARAGQKEDDPVGGGTLRTEGLGVPVHPVVP